MFSWNPDLADFQHPWVCRDTSHQPANEGSKQHLISKLGDYPMYLGDDSNIIMESLYSYVTKERLKLLVDFAKNKMEWSTAEYVDGKTID